MNPPVPPIHPGRFSGLRRATALALAVALLPAAQLDLLAQQAGPYYEQYPQPQMGYGQPAYGQPYYAQPRGYASQPSYPQYGAGQGQQAYGQQPYYPQQQQPAYQQPYGQQYPPQPPNAQYGQGSMQAQPLGGQQLEQLVAPIALYPDPLVAQVLTASTYPAQIAQADRWRQAQGSAPAEQVAAGASAQNWDPSVQALTAFPQVLTQLDQNQRWTSDLGNAYFNQPQDVLDAVQQMRQRAQAAGNLQSNPQQTVSYDQGNYEIAPANPQVVYVPAYNPWAVYGPGLSPYPGYSLLGAIGSLVGAAVQFGLGVGIAPFAQLPFGWLGWGLSWLTHAVLFHNALYVSHSYSVVDRGFAYGGHRAYSRGFNRGPGGYGQNHFNAGYGRAAQGFAGRPVQQTYNRMQPAVNRSAYGFNGNRGLGSSFAGNNSGQRSSGGFGGQQFKGYGGRSPSSGGFHPFGGGGGHAPKSFGGGHSGGGHGGGGHGGGGHSGGGFHLFGKHH